MSPIYRNIVDRAEHMEWPEALELTPYAQEDYERGIDRVDEYRGDPSALYNALTIFQNTGARPYAYAGVAYALFAASYIGGGKQYEAAGLHKADSWLQQARDLAPDQPEIEFIQLFLYLGRGDYDAVLTDLIPLQNAAPEHFHIQLSKLYYRCEKGPQRLAEEQYEKLISMARTENQAQLAHRCIAYFYIYAVVAFGVIGEAVQESPAETIRPYAKKAERVFARMHAYSVNDPWYWHNRSLLYFYTGQHWKAARYNKRALSLMDFLAARKIESDLKKKLWLLYRLA